MKINPNHLQDFNEEHRVAHEQELAQLQAILDRKNIDSEKLISRLQDFQVAIPSWALSAGGTRFGWCTGHVGR